MNKLAFNQSAFGGKWRKYRSIKVTAVAKVMLAQSLNEQKDIIHPSDQIQALVTCYKNVFLGNTA
ncbi:hypothetical protein CS542_10405 [Pedobacter sp. IW39]|nr:hypothetical protein CS542_10405 [Pedobacter sp. IW39]